MKRFLELWNRNMPLRFAIVGGWNFVFGYGVFALLYCLLHEFLSSWIIVVIANILGITNSYIFHRWLTYRSLDRWWVAYLKFYAVYGVQAVLNAVLLEVFVSCWGFNAYVMQFIITVLLTIASYWGHKLYSFRSNHD